MRADGQTWWSWQSLSAISRMRLKTYHLTSSWTNRFTTYTGQANEDSRQGIILHFWCPLQRTCIASCWGSDSNLWGMFVEDRLPKLSVSLYLQTPATFWQFVGHPCCACSQGGPCVNKCSTYRPLLSAFLTYRPLLSAFLCIKSFLF
jgi:hypothetical protein